MMDSVKLQDIISKFLQEKFHVPVSYSATDVPGEFIFQMYGSWIGCLERHRFVPYSWPNARDNWKELNIADPNFFNKLYVVAQYEIGIHNAATKEAFWVAADDGPL